MSKSAKQYRIERDEALARVAALEAMLPTPSKFSKQEILDKHDKWLLRIMDKGKQTGVTSYEELRQFWLFRDLLFKHWNRFL